MRKAAVKMPGDEEPFAVGMLVPKAALEVSYTG
jgi:hypothetical protein